MYYEAILLGAGQGRRMQSAHNKVLLHLLGKPVIQYSLEIFLEDPACQHIILVTQEDELTILQQLVKKVSKKYQKTPPITFIKGGKERQDSVFEGLKCVKEAEQLVMIHDGARPFVTRRQLKALYHEASSSKGAVLAVPVKDTIKKVIDGKITETISRDLLWQVQTPQVFIAAELLAAHHRAKVEDYLGTDDASLIEKYQERSVAVVLGSYENIKLTTPDDMMMGEAIARKRIHRSEKR